MRIGFFDSGIGGLTVLHEALRLLPNEDYIFYADTSHVPYGEKSKEEVRGYILSAAEFIAGQGVKALVIACNTATSIAVEELRGIYDFPILGIEPAVKPAVLKWKVNRKKILVLATQLTLQEAKFINLVKRLDHQDIVESFPLPGLVRLAENYEFEDTIVASYLKEVFSSLNLQQYGTVVLGCTHFPYFESSIRRLFPEAVDIISGNKGTAEHLQRILEARNQINEGTGDILYYKSGEIVDDEVTLANYKKLLQMLG